MTCNSHDAGSSRSDEGPDRRRSAYVPSAATSSCRVPNTATRKSEFYSLGMPDHAAHPTTAEGTYAPTLGTGAYALDLLCTYAQSTLQLESCDLFHRLPDHRDPVADEARSLISKLLEMSLTTAR